MLRRRFWQEVNIRVYSMDGALQNCELQFALPPAAPEPDHLM